MPFVNNQFITCAGTGKFWGFWRGSVKDGLGTE
jgi:hypothetical protein